MWTRLYDNACESGKNGSKMTRLLASLLIALSLPTVAQAVALGHIEVMSHLNERLHAQIALHSISEADAGEVRVALADKATFDNAGVTRAGVLSQLTFKVITNSNGRSYINVSSKRSIREPSLRFIVALQSPQGQLMREYSLLLEATE